MTRQAAPYLPATRTPSLARPRTGDLLELVVSFSGLRQHAETVVVQVADGFGVNSIDFDHTDDASLYGELFRKDNGAWELVEWRSSTKAMPTVLAVRPHIAESASVAA